MITVMNTFTRMMAAFSLSLSLLPGQAFCDVPKEDPFPYTPLEAAQEIRKQVQDAAQIEQMKEVLSAQQQALDALANDFSNSSSSRNAYSGDASAEGMPGFLSAPGDVVLGDEVVYPSYLGEMKLIVFEMDDKNYYGVRTKPSFHQHEAFRDDGWTCVEKEKAAKTGLHFPQVAQIINTLNNRPKEEK